MKPAVPLLLVGLLQGVSVYAAKDRPLASIDGQLLTGEDLKEAFTRNHSGHLAFLAGEVEVRKALDKAIDRQLLLQETERLDLGSRPEVQQAVDELIEKMCFEHLLEVEIEGPAKPTEAEIRAAFDQHTRELVQVRQIVVGTVEEAAQIAEVLKSGQSFEDVAKQRSQVLSKRDGGLLPPIGWGTMEEAWDDVVFKLQTDEISAPFQSRGGLEIVQMVKRIPVEAVEYEKAYGKLQGILLRRKLDARKRDLSARLFTKYAVVIQLQPYDPEAYAAVLAQDPNAPVATWKGGQLPIGEFAGGVDFKGMVHGKTGAQSAGEIESLVRQSINEILSHVEARARDFEKLPEIAIAARQLREDFMESILYTEYVFKDVKVTEADVRAWYDAHQDEVKTPESRQVSHILLATEQEARDARARIDQGESFSDLVKQISKDTETSKRGGDLGWITAREVPLGWEKTLTLAEGQVSEPLQSKFGWHLIRVTKVRPPQPQAFEAVQVDVQKKLLSDQRTAARKAWLEQLRAAAKVKIHDDAVKSFAREIEPKDLTAPEGHAIPDHAKGQSISAGQSVPQSASGGGGTQPDLRQTNPDGVKSAAPKDPKNR